MARYLLIVLTLSSLAGIVFAEEKSKEAPAKETPSAVVERLQSALLDTMKEGEKLGYQGRFDKLAPVIKSTHSFPVVARVALGKNWGTLSDQQKASFLEAFTTLAVASYASNFDKFGGEKFKTVSEKPTERGQVLVRTVLTAGDGQEHKLDYVMEKKEEAWQIINVVADGVSDLALKRAEYESILAKEGFDGLMQKLTQKINDLKTAPSRL